MLRLSLSHSNHRASRSIEDPKHASTFLSMADFYAVQMHVILVGLIRGSYAIRLSRNLLHPKRTVLKVRDHCIDIWRYARTPIFASVACVCAILTVSNGPSHAMHARPSDGIQLRWPSDLRMEEPRVNPTRMTQIIKKSLMHFALDKAYSNVQNKQPNIPYIIISAPPETRDNFLFGD